MNMYGSINDDSLSGNDSNDFLYCGNGNDTAHGGGGSDRLSGGNGDDILFGDAGNDCVYGENGNDKLDGGAGSDIIWGGEGTDNLIGGDGIDYFYYLNSAESKVGIASDTITDFKSSVTTFAPHKGSSTTLGDKIALYLMDANIETPQFNDTFLFIGNANFTRPGQVRFEGGHIFVNVDSNLNPDMEIKLTGVTEMHAYDFFL